MNIFELRSLRRRRQAHVGRLTSFVPPRPPRVLVLGRGGRGDHATSRFLQHCPPPYIRTQFARNRLSACERASMKTCEPPVPPYPKEATKRLRLHRAVCRSMRRGHVGSHVASTLLAHCWRVRVRRLRKRHAPPRTSPPCQVGRRIVPECPRRSDARAVLAVRLSRNGRAFVRELVAQGTCPLDRLEGTTSPDRQTRTEHYRTPRFLTDLVVMGSSYQL